MSCRGCAEAAQRLCRGCTEAPQKQAATVQAAVKRSQHFWQAMLDELPDRCHLPLPLACCWQRCAHCRHQGLLSLGEPPWQPKTANAAVAAPRALHSSACPTRSLHLSSTSSHERASWEAARRDVLAACARAYRILDEDPRGGTGASSSLSCVDFDSSAG